MWLYVPTIRDDNQGPCLEPRLWLTFCWDKWKGPSELSPRMTAFSSSPPQSGANQRQCPLALPPQARPAGPAHPSSLCQSGKASAGGRLVSWFCKKPAAGGRHRGGLATPFPVRRRTANAAVAGNICRRFVFHAAVSVCDAVVCQYLFSHSRPPPTNTLASGTTGSGPGR